MIICQMHVWLVIALLVGGFVVINIVVINFGQKPIGIVGIVSIVGIVPIWFVGLKYIESTGMLDHEPSTIVENLSASAPFGESQKV